MERTLLQDPLAGLEALVAKEDFDEEFLAPSTYAVGKAREIVSCAHERVPELPNLEPVFSTLGDGSVYIRWQHGPREVTVLVPPGDTVPIRLHFSEGDDDEVEGRVTSETLAARLEWLCRG